jgi:hypothetical protein
MRLVAAVLATLLVASSSKAQSSCHAENDGPAFNDTQAMGGPVLGVRFVATASFNAFRAEVWTGESSGTHDIGLWAHDVSLDQPWYPLASGSFQVAPANGWQGALLSTPVAMVAGTTYWLVWKPTPGSQMSIDVLGATPVQVYRASVDNGQTWTPPFQFADRPWKFRIQGDCATTPPSFCTSGTSSHGCTASILAAANPRLSSPYPCLITVAGTEGQKTGIVFYGLAQMQQPWCTGGGGSSYLCVKPPTMRTMTAGTGGALGGCDGSLVLDWTQFQQGSYEALGKPWSVGDRAYVQCWFRDPLSCRSSCTSDALELTYMP